MTEAIVQPSIPIIDRSTRDDADLARHVRSCLFQNPGAVLVRNITDSLHGTGVETALLSFARRIGTLLPQTEAGDIVDRVTFSPGPHVRGAKTRRELPFHTDIGPHLPDVFLLFCVRPASRGGTTILVDGRAVRGRLDHDVLAVLAIPFPFDTSDNARDTIDAVTWRPVLLPGDGSLVVTYNRARIHRGYRILGQHLPPGRAAALDALDAALSLPELHCSIPLRSGDLLCVDNHRFLHARSGFSDDDAVSRLLLRVWLSA